MMKKYYGGGVTKNATRASEPKWNTDVKVLRNRSEVFSFLQKILPQTSGMLYMFTEEIPETIIELLALQLLRDDFYCEHLFSLKTLREKSGSLYNIHYVNQIMPLICSGRNYQPFYDYEEKGNAFLPNWLISEHWSVGLQKDMEGGIVEWDKEKLAWIRQKYESRKKNKRQLLLHFSDATQWGEWLMENRRQYTVETISGRIRPQDVKNHYIEYEPCIMMQLTAEMLKDHLLLPEPMKSEMVALFEVRLEQERQMGNIKFFTKKGMEQFAKTGRIAQFSDLIYRPATVPERIQLLKRFRDWVKQPLQNTCMLDERQINISSRTFVFSTVSLVHNELTLRIGRKGSEYVSICEQGISEKLSKFCYMLESGEMVCTQEECVKAVEKVIAGLEASITSDQSVCGRTGE